MKVVKDQPEVQIKHVTDPLSRLEMVRDAHRDGEIKLTRSIRYKRQPAKPGHIFYRMKFIKVQADGAKTSIYDGAFEMTISGENKLKAENRLTDFLLEQLSSQL